MNYTQSSIELLSSTQSPFKVLSSAERETLKALEKPSQSSALAPVFQQQSAPLAKTTSPPPQAKTAPFGRFFLWVLILGGLGALSTVKIDNYVTGEAEITPTAQKRQQFTMPDAGIVTIEVQPKEKVEKGDRIATITSPELEGQIAEGQRELAQTKSVLKNAEQQLQIAKVQLETALQEEYIARKRTQEQKNELNQQIASGVPKSRQISHEQASIRKEISGIRSEIEGIESEIRGVKHEIAGLNGEIAGYQKQLALIQGRLDRRQPLVEQGVMGEDHQELANLRLEKVAMEQNIQAARNEIKTFQERITQAQTQIQQRENFIGQRESLIAAKSEQVEEVTQDLEGKVSDQEDQLSIAQGRSQVARKEVESALQAIQNQKQIVKRWETELQRLDTEKNKLTLYAERSGTVITEDLDLKNGRRLDAGEEILATANLRELTATVQIRQEDFSLVSLEQPATFQLQDGQNRKYKANVHDMSPTIVSDTPGAAPMATLEILIDNKQNYLLPGAKGYTHIDTGQLRIYQKIQHELSKLFDFGKLLPWLSS